MHPADVGRLTLTDFWMCADLVDEHRRAHSEAPAHARGR